MENQITIRKAQSQDQDTIWEIIQAVIAKGDTYVFAPDSPKEQMLAFWCGKDKHTYVAEINHKIVGTFFIKSNYPDLGSHIANAGYMTAPNESGKGIGRTMAELSLKEAKKLGYQAMQFNFVVKSNEKAIKLWQSVGFQVIGEIPEAFQHQSLGLTNAYIMWKKL